MDAPRRLLIALAAAGALAPAAQGSLSPGSGEAFFGYVKADAPPGATSAALYVDGRFAGRVALERGRVVHPVRARPGRHDLRLRFFASRRPVARLQAEDVFLLPRSAQRAVRERRRDARLRARLATIGAGFRGYAALWVHDLATGTTAGWNSDASFPAVSLVKLAVLVAALDRYGTRPRPRVAKEIRDLAIWSSNLATNSLLVRLGGSEAGGSRVAEEVLARLGATSSTFTGFYRLGTAVSTSAADTPRPLPILTYRRTTAHDVGRILFELHAAALGHGLALRRTRLSRSEARFALGLLLRSHPGGDNRGLLRPSLRGVPMAQKQGWTTYARHTAAIVYAPRGPQIAVLLTYRPNLAPADALALGRRLARVLRR